MALEVLQSEAQIVKSRARLEERGISCATRPPTRVARLWARILGKPQPVPVGDVLKSWDVLKTAEFLERAFSRTARVLDLGAYNSEILSVLHRMGFEKLTGIDMNPGVREMPFSRSIDYRVGDFLRSPFADGSFDAVTAISVIEHGFDWPALLREMSRILRPGGCFVASFDYWPEKIDTAGTKFFGMEWRIFSTEEVKEMVALAERFGLVPEGELLFGAHERPIHCADRNYTFAWIGLRKHGAT
jgi:SAM-dependent methyltransferase